MAKKIINIYYAFEFLWSIAISFFFATYVVFLRSHGLSLIEVNLINVAYMIGVILLEFPTGKIADKYGRKRSFVLSSFAYSFSMLTYFFSSTFIFFVIAELIGALGHALYSGAFEAWMVDEVKNVEKEYDLDHVYINSTKIKLVSTIIGTILGGTIISKMGLNFPWLASSIGMFVMGCLSAVFIKENYFSKDSHTHNIGDDLKVITGNFWQLLINRKILFIAMVSFSFSLSVSAPNMQWQILFNEGLDIKTENLAYIHFLALSFMFAGTSILKHAAKKKIILKKIISYSLLVTGIGIVISASTNLLSISLTGYYLHEFARGSFRPSKQKYIHSAVIPKNRATVISFDSMFAAIGALLGLLINGVLAELYSIQTAWLFSGLFLVAMMISIVLFTPNKKEPN